MKLITIYFERKKQFKIFLTVFRRSAKKCMPYVNLEIVKIPMPPDIDHKRDTAFAFFAAAKYALRSKEDLMIADVDLMFRRSIMDIWKRSFDIAITVRDRENMRYNTGLWFYRPTEASRLFVKQWIINTKKIVKNFCKYEEFSWQYGGIDQASLYMTLKKNKNAKILELPCLEWNATQSEWKHIDNNVRVIHVKSKLRLAAFGKIEVPPEMDYMNPILKTWKRYAI